MKYTIDKYFEKVLFWLVWMLPKRLVYICAIRVGAHATTNGYSDTVVPELSFMHALKRWDMKRDGVTGGG